MGKNTFVNKYQNHFLSELYTSVNICSRILSKIIQITTYIYYVIYLY
jgi:hypothetical protein